MAANAKFAEMSKTPHVIGPSAIETMPANLNSDQLIHLIVKRMRPAQTHNYPPKQRKTPVNMVPPNRCNCEVNRIHRDWRATQKNWIARNSPKRISFTRQSRQHRIALTRMQIKLKTNQSNELKDEIQYDLSKLRNDPPILNASQLGDIGKNPNPPKRRLTGGNIRKYTWTLKGAQKSENGNSINNDKTLLALGSKNCLRL